jgi:hypothetical protein
MAFLLWWTFTLLNKKRAELYVSLFFVQNDRHLWGSIAAFRMRRSCESRCANSFRTRRHPPDAPDLLTENLMIKTEAWLWKNNPSPLALERGEKELTSPGPDDVLVENRAAGLNPVDWKLMEGLSDAWKTDQIPGVDGTGVIVAKGRNVTHLAEGSRVMYHTDLRYDGSFSRYTRVSARAVKPPGDHPEQLQLLRVNYGIGRIHRQQGESWL